MATTAEEREMLRRQKERARKKRHYQRHIGEPKKLHVVPVYLPPDLERLLDELSQKHDQGGGRSGFMRRAFEHYAAHLMGSASPAGVLQIVTPFPQSEGLEIPTVAPPDPAPVEASEIGTSEIGTSEIGTDEQQEPMPAPLGKVRLKKAAKPAKEPPKKPRNMWQQRWFDRAEADAANRVPVRLEFTWPHHHIPHGMRSMMVNNGLKHRKNIWRGRLTPDRAETMAEQIAKYGGTLEITGGLGDEPKWTREEWGGGRQAKDKAA